MTASETPIDSAADPRIELERIFRAASRALRRWQVTRASGHLHDTESYLERLLELAPEVAPASRLDLDLGAERVVARAFEVAKRAMQRWHVSGEPEHLGVAGQQLEVLLEAAPLETVSSALPELARDLADQLRAIAPRVTDDLN